MDPVIATQGLTCRYGRTLALNNVSLEVPPGVVFALLGENGAGKTTLIRTLTGFQRPDDGTSAVLGMDPQREALKIRRRVGYVSDAPVLYDWMRVSRIGWFASGFYGDDYLPRYRSLIGGFEVPWDRKIKALSKGMRAKVALALALAHDPALLILDEPTSGLDPLVRRQFLESMVDRVVDGRTVLLSSHQIAEVERVADWVAILHEGTVKLVRPLAQLKEETKRLTITWRDPWVEPPEFSGQVLSDQWHQRQQQLVVTAVDSQVVDTFRNHHAVSNVTVQTPTLEEIFIACTHVPREPQRPGPPGSRDQDERVGRPAVA